MSIEQKRAERRKRLGTAEGMAQVQEEAKPDIIIQDKTVPVPALFQQGQKCNGWILTENGWEMRNELA